MTCDLNRVKELKKGVARRALKRAAVVGNASMTCTTIDSPRSRRSVTPPSPFCRASSSYSLDNDVPRNDFMTQQLRDILVHCTASCETIRPRVSDHQLLPDVSDGLSADRDAWFLPLSDGRSPRRDKARRRRASTLDDIDESVDETVVHRRHPVAHPRPPTVPQPIIAWASDVECDVTAEKHEDDTRTAPRLSDVQTQLTIVERKHQSTHSPNSDPAVSLGQYRDHCTPVAGGVQSDFILSSTTRPVTALFPREAVGKMQAEGDHTTSDCCPLSSTVCNRLGDCVLPADTPGDCCQLQSSVKISSKLNLVDVLPVGGVDSDCLATSASLTCYRVEQVKQDNSNCSEMTRDTNKVTDRRTSRTSAGRDKTLQRTTDSGDYPSAVRAVTSTDDSGGQPQQQTRRRSDSKPVHDATDTTMSRTEVVEKHESHAEGNSACNGSGWSSSPRTAKLFADLISKISELATRQDQLERTTPTSRRTVTDKSSQTDDQRRQIVDKPGTPHVSSTSSVKPSSDPRASNRHQLQDGSARAGQSIVRKEDGRSSKQSSKPRGVSGRSRESQIPEHKTSSQTSNALSHVTHTTPTNDDATVPTRLTDSSSSGRQRDDVGVAEEQRPPAQSVEPSPSPAVTDNIIHIVRGSSALDDLTAEELVRQCSESCRLSDESAARCYQPAPHSQPLDEAPVKAESLVRNASPWRHRGSAISEDSRQHSPQPGDDRRRRQDTSSDSLQQRRDPETTHDDRQVSAQSLHDSRVDSVLVQHHHDRNSIQIDPEYSPRRESKTPQDVVVSASSLRRFKRTGSEEHRLAEGDRTAAERRQQTRTSQRTSVKTADDHAMLRMQYV